VCCRNWPIMSDIAACIACGSGGSWMVVRVERVQEVGRAAGEPGRHAGQRLLPAACCLLRLLPDLCRPLQPPSPPPTRLSSLRPCSRPPVVAWVSKNPTGVWRVRVASRRWERDLNGNEWTRWLAGWPCCSSKRASWDQGPPSGPAAGLRPRTVLPQHRLQVQLAHAVGLGVGGAGMTGCQGRLCTGQGRLRPGCAA
jgi:hypothetical protein